MSTSVEKGMVADGEIVVLSCKNVVILCLLMWWEASNGAGFVILDAKKLMCGDAPEVGQSNAVQIVKCGWSNARAMGATAPLAMNSN
jgi:hypothetical protein